LIVTLQAFNDVAQARDWYEKQRPVLVKDARRANMKRFPYGIWFKVEVDPVVFACLHHRRNPALIKGRAP